MNTHLFKRQSHNNNNNNNNNINMASPSSTSSGNSLGINKNSRVISKVQPKIRIIHIFAPEIIKTDVANFRELVQRLTGKPSPESMAKGKAKKVKRSSINVIEADNNINSNIKTNNNNNMVSTKLEVMMMGGVSGSSSSPSSSSDLHHQQEGWRSSSTCDLHNNSISSVGGVSVGGGGGGGGGYLTAFTDLDDNFDFSHVFQMGANDGSTHLNAF